MVTPVRVGLPLEMASSLGVSEYWSVGVLEIAKPEFRFE
jgi:hypothetical protein